jgi:DNA-binding MarR family transcriptional regulator
LACADFPGDAPLAVLLVALGHRLAYLVERRLARHDYNHTQAATIMILSRRPGAMAQDLASPVKVEPPSITRALQALERRGLVSRQPHPTDGRASLFHLTDQGQEAATTIARLMREVSAELEECVAPGQLADLRAALGAMFSRIEHMRDADT